MFAQALRGGQGGSFQQLVWHTQGSISSTEADRTSQVCAGALGAFHQQATPFLPALVSGR